MLGVLAVAAGAGWAYVRSQYYVGVDGEQVAIFRGVDGAVGPVAFSTLEQRTALATERLDPIAANRVEQGIVAEDRAAAEQIVARLEEQFPECTPLPSAVPTPAVSAVPTPAGSAAALPSAVPSAVPSPTGAAPVDTGCPA